jgi:uncharacterized protein with NRDE domain
MCLIAFAWQTDPERPLVLIANRDEFHERPAAPLAFWSDAPEIAAGRDLREHGTWIGLSRRGRMAAVTNAREASDMQKRPRSRGALTTEFLLGTHSAAEHAESLSADAAQYGGYNLLLWDGRELVYASNRPSANWHRVEPGVHGLSNAQLDTPWPKVRWAHRELDAWMHDGAAANSGALLAAMTTRDIAADAELPDTGVGIETERLLAPPFIYRPGYGTRCTTWLQVDRNGNAQIRERRYDDQAQPAGDSELSFSLS